MKFFKNTELAKIYNVSEKSVRNWVQATQEGKLDLQLHEKEGRFYVANVTKNTILIEQLIEKGRKYKNKRALKTISPKPEFYETFDHKQILDIISHLTIHHEIPLPYSYVNGGATYWDDYANRLANEGTRNMLTATIDLLGASTDTLDHLVGGHKYVNIVDLGPGNGMPAKGLLEHFLKLGKLKRYVTLDISKEMLQIAEKNIGTWFDGRVKFEGYARDFSRERFDDLFTEDAIGKDESDTPVNIVLLLGATLGNLRTPDQALWAINNSLGINDLLVYSAKLDTVNSRRYFDFTTSANQKLAYNHRMILDFLNIDEDLYDVVQNFDEKKQARSISITPKMALTVKFTFPQGFKYIHINKGQLITVWRYWHHDGPGLIEQFERNDFDMMQATKTKDQEFLLLTSKIKTHK
ncbi:MAG TPA: L-histidine N(alpha)-methyltransferase [Verrucomicrobiae bacterium]|nr:L-histidine N(alpha)-methyltransferase [Verrucomicrobiae bacterium]